MQKLSGSNPRSQVPQDEDRAGQAPRQPQPGRHRVLLLTMTDYARNHAQLPQVRGALAGDLGPGQPGSSREISPTVSGASTMMLWSGFSRRAFTITGSSGLCATCFRPDTWKTGYGAPRLAGHRKAEWSPRFCPISTCTGWTILSRES